MLEGIKAMVVTSLRLASFEADVPAAFVAVGADVQVQRLVGVRVTQLSSYLSPTLQQIAPV